MKTTLEPELKTELETERKTKHYIDLETHFKLETILNLKILNYELELKNLNFKLELDTRLILNLNLKKNLI